jgi:hypothetical protein
MDWVLEKSYYHHEAHRKFKVQCNINNNISNFCSYNNYNENNMNHYILLLLLQKLIRDM